MFSLVVQMEVRPGRREEFLAGMAANAEASVRDEPGCLRFDVCAVDGRREPLRPLRALRRRRRRSRRTRRRRTSRSGGRSPSEVVVGQVNTPGDAAGHPHRRGVRMSSAARPAVDGPAPGGDRALRPRQRRRHDPVRRQVELPRPTGSPPGMTVFSPGTGIPLHSHNVEETRPRLRGRGHRGRRRRRVRPGRRPGHLGAGRRPALLPQPRRGHDDHLLGLRRPRRHPHGHRDRRDVRAPVGRATAGRRPA